MFEINYLNDYYNTPDFINLVNEIYELTSFLENDYPNFNDWFFNKQIKNLKTTRTTLFVQDNKKIIAVAHLKNDNEKKICTIYVREDKRNLKIGTSLLNKSFEILNTTSPIITFKKHKLKEFESIINKYNWKLTDTTTSEYEYNNFNKKIKVIKKTSN